MELGTERLHLSGFPKAEQLKATTIPYALFAPVGDTRWLEFLSRQSLDHIHNAHHLDPILGTKTGVAIVVLAPVHAAIWVWGAATDGLRIDHHDAGP
jgi:hypothetical protein